MAGKGSKRTRMSAGERRKQLIEVARGLFATKGFDGTSIEEIASRAKVSKPVVYEHFGGKEGLYAVIVDRELNTISTTITRALSSSSSASVTVERAALALLTYIEDSPDGFRILSSGNDRASGTYSTFLADVAIQVSGLLAAQFSDHGNARALAAALHNDLQGAAVSLRPELAEVIGIAEASGALRAIVSGSGPTVAALVPDAASATRVTRALTASALVGGTARVDAPVAGARAVG